MIADKLPPFDLGRIAAQSAKQVIVQKVRDAERDRQYEEYKDRIGEIINGVVKRVEYGNVIVDLGRSEGIVRRDELIPREVFRPAIAANAHSLVLVHNHPSGDPTPSQADIEVTRRLIAAGEPLGIVVHDHVVIGKGRHASFRSLGLI
mgnify:CR=1 FL=1